MKVQQLTLAHFRGFDQLDLTFEQNVTVIAGVNGAGKSGVLKALAAALSLALPRFTASVETPLGLTESDVQFGKPGLSLAAVFNLDSADIYVDMTRAALLDSEKAEALIKVRDDLRFATRETKRGSKEELELKDELRRINLQLQGENDTATVRFIAKDPSVVTDDLIASAKAATAQPLAVFYSTARFLSRLPPKLNRTKPIRREMAYIQALTQLEVSLNDFANWYRVINEGSNPKLAKRMRHQLESAIGAFLPGVSELQLHEGHPSRFSIQKNGIRFYLEQLSDGERGLLALVFDLTRRLATANPESNNPIGEGAAIVMIDEIELHLHPSWQRRVLRTLSSIFKQCQFIITTHSPQVIGQAAPETLRLLLHDGYGKVVPARISQSFGMDSSWILQNIMGVPARDYDSEQRLSQIFQAIDDEDFISARERANHLRRDIGDFAELQEAFALLDRLEMLGS